MTFLSACGTTKTITVATPVLPPAQYLQECVAQLVPIRTNGDLAINYQALKRALKLCNADKAALRAWAASLEDSQTKDILEDMANVAPLSEGATAENAAVPADSVPMELKGYIRP